MAFQQFPAHVYHLHYKGYKRVEDQAAFDALEAHDPGWSFDRSPTALEAAFHKAMQQAAPSQEAAIVQDQKEQEVAQLREAAERTSLYEAAVTELLRKLDGAPIETLERVKRYEEENPKGPRSTLVKAVEKLIAIRQAEAPPVGAVQ